jgi:hypothetical protein
MTIFKPPILLSSQYIKSMILAAKMHSRFVLYMIAKYLVFDIKSFEWVESTSNCLQSTKPWFVVVVVVVVRI